MTKDKKTIARLNPLITLLLLLPALIFGKHAYDSYQRIKTGVTAEDENYYYVYTALGRYAYLKEAIDKTRSEKNPSFVKADQVLGEAYASSVELASGYHKEQRWIFGILSGLSAAFLVFAIWYRRAARAELLGNTLTLRLPPAGRKVSVKTGDIRTIHVEAAAPCLPAGRPLLPAPTEISKVNWQNNVWIAKKNGDMIVVSPLLFPAFHKILEKVATKNPKIKTA